MTKKNKHPAEVYARAVISGDIDAPKYVIKQCQDFINTWDDKNDTYCINQKLLDKIYKITKVLKMAKGPKAGKTIYSALAGYQWLLITATICTVRRDDKRKRRYERVLLEIARKNGKTFVVAVLFILLFYLEPAYSRFFSVAPDGQLAREIKEAIEPIITTNIDIFEDGEFKVLRDYILHKPTKTKYTPLNYSTNRLDGKEPSVFIVDEAGALPTAYAIGAMRSGQLLVMNRLGFVISTKYPTSQNPFEDEVAYSKKVLDGVIDNDKVFSLLYEPDNTKDWATDDSIMRHANPLALELDPVWNELIDNRRDAIEVESQRENFITKHCNIIYQGAGTESYVSIDQIKACKTESIDWSGRIVYVGVDLAMTNDNCSVVMCSVDDDENILALPMIFVPEGRIEEKTRFEKLDYRQFIRNGQCIACGDMTVDYAVIEDYVFGLEDKYGVQIQAIGYDRYNALSSAQKWEQKYNTVEVRQHSDTLHMPTKLLKEKILDRKFRYESNRLYEINYENARCTYDTGLRAYVNKKKSCGKIDAVAATIDAVYLLQQDIIFGDDGFIIQTA
jgi:phage terminase large subunit-like protein